MANSQPFHCVVGLTYQSRPSDSDYGTVNSSLWLSKTVTESSDGERFYIEPRNQGLSDRSIEQEDKNNRPTQERRIRTHWVADGGITGSFQLSKVRQCYYCPGVRLCLFSTWPSAFLPLYILLFYEVLKSHGLIHTRYNSTMRLPKYKFCSGSYRQDQFVIRTFIKLITF
jgi:hypothetical protein